MFYKQFPTKNPPLMELAKVDRFSKNPENLKVFNLGLNEYIILILSP